MQEDHPIYTPVLQGRAVPPTSPLAASSRSRSFLGSVQRASSLGAAPPGEGSSRTAMNPSGSSLRVPGSPGSPSPLGNAQLHALAAPGTPRARGCDTRPAPPAPVRTAQELSPPAAGPGTCPRAWGGGAPLPRREQAVDVRARRSVQQLLDVTPLGCSKRRRARQRDGHISFLLFTPFSQGALGNTPSPRLLLASRGNTRWRESRRGQASAVQGSRGPHGTAPAPGSAAKTPAVASSNPAKANPKALQASPHLQTSSSQQHRAVDAFQGGFPPLPQRHSIACPQQRGRAAQHTRPCPAPSSLARGFIGHKQFPGAPRQPGAPPASLPASNTSTRGCSPKPASPCPWVCSLQGSEKKTFPESPAGWRPRPSPCPGGSSPSSYGAV